MEQLCSTLQPILSVNNLSKTFGSVAAVQDLSFVVNAGDIYGFLGQNGAGKSTTMRMMLGLVRPDAGDIRIGGERFHQGNRKLLKHIGAIIERPDMYGYLSGVDNLRIFARLSGIKVDGRHLDDVLELVGLNGRGRDKFKTYSQGMKQRLGIAVALVHNPDILILDEPTNGLDPQGIADVRALIIHLCRERGKTVIISSHLLHEIEQMATRMIIIHEGKKISEGEVSQLLHPEETLIEVAIESNISIAGSVAANPRWQAYLQHADAEKILLKMNPAHVPELTRWLVAQGAAVRHIEARHSLESYFLSLTDHARTAAH